MDIEEDLEACLEAIKDSVRDETSRTVELDWDYRSELSNEQVEQILDGQWDEVESNLWELNTDAIAELEEAIEKDAVSEHRHELYELDPDKSIDDWVSEFREDGVFDNLSVNVNLEGLVKQSGLCRVQIRTMENKDWDAAVPMSHYDAMQSGGYTFANECPVGKLVEVLELDAQAVKDVLVERGWYDMEFANDPDEIAFIEANCRAPEEAAVSLKDLVAELNNTTSGWNHLTFMAEADLKNWASDDPRFVTVPQGNFCGLYDPLNGGGSVMEMELLKPIRFDLDDPCVLMKADCAVRHGIDDVFGMSRSAWGGELDVEYAPNPVEVKQCDETIEMKWNSRASMLLVSGSGSVELGCVEGIVSIGDSAQATIESAESVYCSILSCAKVGRVKDIRVSQEAKAFVGIAESYVNAWDRAQVEVAQTEADCKVCALHDAKVAVGLHCGEPEQVATVGVNQLSDTALQLYMNASAKEVKKPRNRTKGIK